LTFGIAICHEAFRYPEITRALVLGGAQVVFVPHFVTTDDGSLPTGWCDARNPYNEKALLPPGAREHRVRRRVERGRGRTRAR
jgi:predicted amidohydrolase